MTFDGTQSAICNKKKRTRDSHRRNDMNFDPLRGVCLPLKFACIPDGKRKIRRQPIVCNYSGGERNIPVGVHYEIVILGIAEGCACKALSSSLKEAQMVLLCLLGS